jgi:uncharacterized protein involved in outer membrane biogenesis
MSGNAHITGGTIPTLNAALSINGLRLEQLASLVPLFSNASGICNISLRLSTNGSNQLSWISNLQGTAGLRGRDILVCGFNMPGIIQAVAYVRTVADVLNAVKRSFPKGSTLFSTLEGEWDISKGVLETLNTKVSNAQTDGTISSKINMVNWDMNTIVNFSLKALDRTNPPSIIVKMYGNMDTPSFDFDTSPLEQYVNNKTSEKMMQNYGH